MSSKVMTREEIQAERMRLGAMIAMLELQCPHAVYEVSKNDTEDVGFGGDLWYDCFCHDCYKQWTVYPNSVNFEEVKEKYESLNV